jgi:hypothetical protein
MFGTQIMQHGKITDFECANYIWDKLTSHYNEWTWVELDDEFRPIHKSVLTEFRKVAPKDVL